MASLSADDTRTLAMLIERGVLVPMKKDRIIELFTHNGEVRCTCTSCGDGDRIGRILDRLFDIANSRKVHLFTDNGGPLAHCDDSPLLVADGWSNEHVHRTFRQIEKAQKLLGKGRAHASITHFPCGAATYVKFNVVEQLQMFARAVCFKKDHLDVDPAYLITLVHIEWGSDSHAVLGGEFAHLFKDYLPCDLAECLFVFKKSPWIEYCGSCGIPPELDVHEYNVARFGRPVSRAPVSEPAARFAEASA